VLPAYAVLVLDEAQNIEDAATNFLGSSFTPLGLRMLLHRLSDSRGHGALPALEQAVMRARALGRERRALPAFAQQKVYPEIAAAEDALDGGFSAIERAWRTIIMESGQGRSRPALAAGVHAAPGAAPLSFAGSEQEQALKSAPPKPLRIIPTLYQHPAFVEAQAAAHHLASRLELAAQRAGQFLTRAEPAMDMYNTRDFVIARAAAGSLLERAQDLKGFFDPTSGAAEMVKWLQPEFARRRF
jgi:Rad3-related DNA helicase